MKSKRKMKFKKKMKIQKKKRNLKKKMKRKNFQNSKMSELNQCQCQTMSVADNVRI